MAAGGGDVAAPVSRWRLTARWHRVAMTVGPGSGADLAVVFGEDEVADPVQAVLDAAVPAECLGELVSADVITGHGDDRVDDLGVPRGAGQ